MPSYILRIKEEELHTYILFQSFSFSFSDLGRSISE